jgi:hypothetical protein
MGKGMKPPFSGGKVPAGSMGKPMKPGKSKKGK